MLSDFAVVATIDVLFDSERHGISNEGYQVYCQRS